MSKRIYIAVLVLVLTMVLQSCGKKITLYDYAIIPQPVQLQMDKGSFTLSAATKCYAVNIGQNDPSVKYLSRMLRQWHLNPVLVGKPESNCLWLVVNETADPELGDEGYTLDVDKDAIVISANGERGLFYGMQTFIQMMPEDIADVRYSSITLPACHIRDYPRFAWRGSHFDVSRHFFAVSQIKKHLELMAQFKMNKFHWHLTDDHGWRIEISKYPLLNDVGSWRVDRDDQPWGEADPARPGEQRTNGGYYTKEEIAEVVAFAAERYIEVIPEIDIPGHCCAILEAYPDLACAGDDTTYTVQFGPYWPPRAILCAGNDSVIAFLNDVMDEVMPLFPSQYIHIGGDEAVKDNWERCPRCNKRKESLHLKDFNQLQNWLIGRVEQHVESQGKTIIGWDEILDGDLSPSATIMSWQGVKTGIAAARKGLDVIMTPVDYCYLNYYQANADYQPAAMPNFFIPLSKVYQFDPMPAVLSKSQQKHILGAQCNLWTEYVSTPEMAEYMLLPRLCAMAEVLWTPQAQRNWGDFRHRMERGRQRLEANDYVVAPGSFQPVMTVEKHEGDSRLITIESEREDTHVYYHNGDGRFVLYTAPFKARHGDTIHTRSFFNGIAREKEYRFPIN